MRIQVLPPHLVGTLSHRQRLGLGIGQIVDAEQPLVSTGSQPLGIGGKVHRLDDVLVREGHQLLTRNSVPNFGTEITRGRRREKCLWVQAAGPHGSLVALPRADPVAGGTVAHHGTFVVAGRDEEGAGRAAGLVGGGRRIDVGDGGELEFGQGSGVARADDGDLPLPSLLGAAHCILPCCVVANYDEWIIVLCWFLLWMSTS